MNGKGMGAGENETAAKDRGSLEFTGRAWAEDVGVIQRCAESTIADATFSFQSARLPQLAAANAS
jgi:hypothetical protein